MTTQVKLTVHTYMPTLLYRENMALRHKVIKQQ